MNSVTFVKNKTKIVGIKIDNNATNFAVFNLSYYDDHYLIKNVLINKKCFNF